MGKLLDRIRAAVREERYLVSWHADRRCEERNVSDWQLVVGLNEAQLIRERPTSQPHPSVVVRQSLVDGTEVEVVWAWMAESDRALLVTVFFPE